MQVKLLMDDFETIQQDSSDILFSLRQFDPPVSPVLNKDAPNGLPGDQIIQQVLASPRIKNAVTEIAQKQGESVDVIFQKVQIILEDIGHTFTLKSIRFVGYFLRKVFRNIYRGIKVNVAGLEKVKELCKELPVVLVPSHRSYTDFLLVSFVCFIYQLPLPVIAAAQDFKNMTLIGGLLRSCGAFYMKRSFRSDELYWIVFFEYVQSLVLNSGTMMEFFIEGTRSRSGKSLHPKQGLLSILTDLYFTSRVPDIIFCPVSISYERVLEETLLARELLGVPKPKESFKGLLKSSSVLSDDYGFAYLYFGKPISLREFSDGKVSRVGKACIPRCIRSDQSPDEMVVVRKLAGHILNRIQDHLIILPNMLVAFILLQNPGEINLETLIKQYNILVGWCKICGIPLPVKGDQDSRSIVIESIQLLKSSATLSEDNRHVYLVDPKEHFCEEYKSKIRKLLSRKHFHGSAQEEPNCTESSSGAENCVNERHLKDSFARGSVRNWEDKSAECELSATRVEDKEYLIHLTSVHLQLAHQRNQLLHWFYVPDQLYCDSKFLGDLLSVEVARDTFPLKKDFFSQLDSFKGLGVFINCDGIYNIQTTEAFGFFFNLWSPLLTSYWVVYSYIIESCMEGKEYISDTLIQSCQEFAMSLFLKGVVVHLEIQSLELLKNGLKSLQKLDIVRQVKYGAEKRVLILNKEALYDLAVIVGGFLQLSYLPSLISKL